MRRRSGILLHPTSLPGPGALGDIAAGYPFVDWLAAHGQSIWQILPLNPPGAGISPYTCQSSHAGNPALISLSLLAQQTGLLTQSECEAHITTDSIEQGIAAHYRLLSIAATRVDKMSDQTVEAFRQWCIRNDGWLASDALFHAISLHQRSNDWTTWPKALMRREPSALHAAAHEFAAEVHRWKFIQWVFDEQWLALKSHANRKGVQILGDLPIYCAHASVDVWSHQALFELSDNGQASVVAGVPPDYFSATGQRWGSPLYRWEMHKQDGFAWWRGRIASALKWCDRLRIDHFRAFASYWEIPQTSPDATTGRWVDGPGMPFFDAMRQDFDPLPIVVEDLGDLTEDVIELREKLGLPGMSILQFAFGGDAQNVYLPHNLTRNTVVYTGTHDNNTSCGWWSEADANQQAHFRQYFGSRSSKVHRVMIRAALGSVADLAIIPMQDVIGADADARMNIPGRADGQWTWRFDWSQLKRSDGQFIARMTRLFGREPEKSE
ncbi:MAG: 4-alpha-glucanotransferase [Burkholderiaceae bacterium]